MAARTYAYTILLSTSFVVGCTGTELAPDCFNRDANDRCIVPEYLPPPEEMTLDCGMPPGGAVGANYSHTVTFTGPSSVVFEASGLPDGLQMGGTTGQIYGAPTLAGIFDEVSITMTDTVSGAEVDATCPAIEINEALTHDLFDMPPTAPLGCLPVGETLDDHILGGNGGTWTCDASGAIDEREGEGVIPAGVTFDTETCTASGTPTEDFIGTWVWMVAVTQASQTIYVPFCATKEGQNFHDIALSIDAQPVDLAAPVLMPFDPDQELSFGETDNFRFEITETCANNSCLHWAFQHRMLWSPFDSFAQEPYGPIKDGMNKNVGLFHHLRADMDGNTVEEQGFGDRAWVANWRMWYCTDGGPDECATEEDVFANGQSKVVWAAIAYPN